MCVVADEIQILGDKSRGVNIEVLLTLTHRAKPGQFVGLSAVLNKHDGDALTDWLRIPLIRVPHREKHLRYECRTPSKRLTFRTDARRHGIREEPLPPLTANKLQPLIHECMAADNRKPIVVFCMRKQDVYDGCREYCTSQSINVDNVPPFSTLSNDTPEAALLSATLPHRVAIHCADLLEDDRLLVEDAIRQQNVDLVFSTSTLAAGVNFPLGTVIFYSWRRWNQDRRIHEPISAAEFHNMAGRCGRMGSDHESGHVIFLARDGMPDQPSAREFLDPDHLDTLQSRVSPKYFSRLVLQLAASNVATDEPEALRFLKATFGASRELQSNASGLDHWDTSFSQAVAELRGWGFLR